jgi:RHS repeat-associated protein
LRWLFVSATDRHVPDAAIHGAGEKYRLVTDPIGSLRLVIRGSDGVVVQRMRQDAWGRVEEDLVAAGFARVPFGFAGGMSDQVTGLVHFGAREYDPEVGRWVERDPIGFAGGTTGLYEYCCGAPIGLVDVSGAKPGDPFPSALQAGLDAVRHLEGVERAAGTDNEWAGFVYRSKNTIPGNPLRIFHYAGGVWR